ncbi:glutamine synthetase family protein [Halioxenophilus sp. WMMB6]|uniref:glutamine synthetase family protein n=1 Tax=Halioxenophilus sp. WMMB6 TaxID=3073815 RepID=UPI00295F3C3D|nr:glutamine synthetase family protein [Halioxenophilus sp. WMMB6]
MINDESQLKLWLKENGITEVEALVPDMTGNARGKILPASKYLNNETTRLPEAIFIQTVTGDWPDDEAIDDLVHPADIDLYLKPDTSTIRMVPWVDEPTAQIIHDCYDAQGNLHPLAPRNVLKRVLALYERDGLRPVVAPELEFYLVQKNTDADFPLQPPIGRSGRPERARQSYSIDAVNEFDPLFEEMYDFCDAMELDVDTLIHESGAAQMEVNFEHADPLSRADQVFLFKRTIREVAMRHNVYATFLAKPMQNEPGSSMHIHQSLVDSATGKNIFSGPNGELTDVFKNYLAGLQHFTPTAMLLYAPNVNSYRRILFGDAAPNNTHWGFDNRTAGLRVPVSTPEATRVESRFAGSDVNPYLAIAATLACGYLGMKHKMVPSDAVVGDAHELGSNLPKTIEHSMALLSEPNELSEILGEKFVKAYVAIKFKEYETFFQVISSWEREYLLLNV